MRLHYKSGKPIEPARHVLSTPILAQGWEQEVEELWEPLQRLRYRAPERREEESNGQE
jgi:hypothetical protein